MNKRGMALSINTIIIVIIALVFLGIAITFVIGMFDDLEIPDYPTIDIPPTADEPIKFNPSVIERGKDNKMTIAYYNNELAEIDSSVKPSINCEGIETITVTTSGLNIPIGEFKEYSALVNIPSNTPPGQYSCTLTLSESDQTFFMEVK